MLYIEPLQGNFKNKLYSKHYEIVWRIGFFWTGKEVFYKEYLKYLRYTYSYK